MKKISFVFCLAIFFSTSYALDFSGDYQCDTNYDAQDGKYTALITLKLNKGYVQEGSSYATYDFSMKAIGYDYFWTGIAAANGNNLAVYFESVGPKREPSDKGVGIATIVTDKDATGKDVVSLHKFFYEAAYKGKPDYGFENCVLKKKK
jgi:hypothetical protein